MVYDSRRLVLYFRRSPDNRVVLGGRASFLSGRATSAQVADYSVLEGVLLRIFPQLKGVAIDYRWTGLVGITFGYLPHYHGRGVALANRAGAWLGRKLSGHADPHDIPAVPIKANPFPPVPLDASQCRHAVEPCTRSDRQIVIEDLPEIRGVMCTIAGRGVVRSHNTAPLASRP